jgi:putative DNA primase/helicase
MPESLGGGGSFLAMTNDNRIENDITLDGGYAESTEVAETYFKQKNFWTDEELAQAVIPDSPTKAKEPWKPKPQTPKGSIKSFVKHSELCNTEWLWRHRIPLKCLTMISGEQGHGKSTMIYDLMARLTTGRDFPDGEQAKRCKVLILSCEDNAEDSAGPKLVAAGADLSMIHGWDNTFTIDDLPRLEQTLKDNPDIKLVMIEPIYEIIKGDTNAITNVTKPLGLLQEMAGRRGVAILGVHHFGKSKAENSNQKTLGSIGFTSKARACWGIVLKKDDPNTRIFAAGKHNVKINPQALQFTITDATVEANGQTIETAKVVWLTETITTSLDELLQQGNGQTTPEDAQKWLASYLTDAGDEADSNQIMLDGASAGFSKKQLWHAKEKIGVKSVKRGMNGGWAWRLDSSAGTVNDKHTYTPKREIDDSPLF